MSRKTNPKPYAKYAKTPKDVENNPELFVPIRKRVEPHFHFNELGVMVKCYHEGKSLITNWRFWAGMTLGFPAEHLIWEKIWPFYLVTAWLGL